MLLSCLLAGVLWSVADSPPIHPPTQADLDRAMQPRPDSRSHVHGRTPKEAFANMNRVLEADEIRTIPCEQFDHATLNGLARILYNFRADELDQSYRQRGDRRAMHFNSLEHKERLWMGEQAASQAIPSHAVGTSTYNATRDGKCAELVMWYYHHLSQGSRQALAMVASVTMPLMPQDVALKEARSNEYDQQIGCTSCHVPVHVPGAPPITPIHRKNSSAPQYPMTCPADPKTGKPTVWYEPVQGQQGLGKRIKRCDWDYEPFCQPCEGRGGMTWGNDEDQWAPMPCEPVAEPEDIPKANLTNPIWPKSFSVQEYAQRTFPGLDPCNVKMQNSTYTLEFVTRPDGPIYHSDTHSGARPGSAWHYPNGDFYGTTNILGHPIFCVCLNILKDPARENAIVGPLTYDFAQGAKLVGRERILPEYMSSQIVADHWVKGPHHFWVDVATNQMVREWQPFNGLQTYYGWNYSTPHVQLPKICYKGLLHYNISCAYPTPDPL